MCFFEVFGQRTVRPALKLTVDDMAVVFILIVCVHVSAQVRLGFTSEIQE